MLRLFATLVCLLAPIYVHAQSNTPEAEKARAAAIIDDVAALEALSGAGLNLTKLKFDGRALLSYAASYGSADVSAYLLQNGADINAVDTDGYTAVMRALESGYVEIAKLLGGIGADLTTIANDGHSVRTLAEQAGLENFGPEPPNTPALTLTLEEANQIALAAAEAGDLTAFKFAIENGADARVTAENGWSALMLSALGGHYDFVKYLIDNKYSPSFGRAKPYSVTNITAIHAALVFTKSKDGDSVIEILQLLRKTSPFAQKFKDTKFAKIVEKSSFDAATKSKLSLIFPHPPLPELDYELPVGMAPTTSGWKAVQSVLAKKGLYTGGIDGKPGPNTYRALLAYVEPLAYDILDRAKVAADRSIPRQSIWSKHGRSNVLDGYWANGSVNWTAGEYDFSNNKRLGYHVYVYGKISNGFLSKENTFRAEYNKGKLRAYVSFLTHERNSSGSFSGADLSINLFDDQVYVSFKKDSVSVCELKFAKCHEMSIKRNFSKYDIGPSLHLQFNARKNAAEKAAADNARIKKEQDKAKRLKEEKERLEKIKKERQERFANSENLLPLRANDLKIEKDQFFAILRSRMLVLNTGHKVWYGTTGDYQVWGKNGKKSTNSRRYAVTDKNNICVNPGEEQYCHYWVSNGESVLFVSNRRRYLLTQTLSELERHIETDQFENDLSLKSEKLPSRSEFAIKAGDEDLNQEQLTRLVIGKKLMTLHDGSQLKFGRDRQYTEWQNFKKSMTVPYRFMDGLFVHKDSSGKIQYHRFVFSKGSLVMVSKRSRTFIRRN